MSNDKALVPKLDMPDFKMPNFDIQNFCVASCDVPYLNVSRAQMPAGLRAFAVGVSQCGNAYHVMKAGADNAAGLHGAAYSAEGVSDYGLKMIEAARLNTNAAFDFAGRLITAKALSDVIEVSNAHACKQFEALTQQHRELNAVAQQLATEIVGLINSMNSGVGVQDVPEASAMAKMLMKVSQDLSTLGEKVVDETAEPSESGIGGAFGNIGSEATKMTAIFEALVVLNNKLIAIARKLGVETADPIKSDMNALKKSAEDRVFPSEGSTAPDIDFGQSRLERENSWSPEAEFESDAGRGTISSERGAALFLGRNFVDWWPSEVFLKRS